MSAPFPLDAEQTVRLAGYVLAALHDIGRHPDTKRADLHELTRDLAEWIGVDLPVEADAIGVRVLPYRRPETLAPTPSMADFLHDAPPAPSVILDLIARAHRPSIWSRFREAVRRGLSKRPRPDPAWEATRPATRDASSSRPGVDPAHPAGGA